MYRRHSLYPRALRLVNSILRITPKVTDSMTAIADAFTVLSTVSSRSARRGRWNCEESHQTDEHTFYHHVNSRRKTRAGATKTLWVIQLRHYIRKIKRSRAIVCQHVITSIRRYHLYCGSLTIIVPRSCEPVRLQWGMQPPSNRFDEARRFFITDISKTVSARCTELFFLRPADIDTASELPHRRRQLSLQSPYMSKIAPLKRHFV